MTHSAPAWRAEYERIYGAPVTFDAPWNAVLLDEKWLNHKIATQPRYVFGILSVHADALLKNLENSKTARGRVGSLLMPILHKGEANMEAIALNHHAARQFVKRSQDSYLVEKGGDSTPGEH